MALAPTYTLTVDLATIDGADAAGITVEVAMANPRLIFALDSESLYPTSEHATTDSNGVALFILLPSTKVGDYKITIGSYSRIITMPERDARLSEFDQGGKIPSAGPGPAAGANVHMWSQPTNAAPTAIPVGAVAGFPHIDFAEPDANGFLVIAQESSENDLTHITKNGVEQITAFTKGAATFDQGGVTYEYWITMDGPLFPATLAGMYTLRRV